MRRRLVAAVMRFALLAVALLFAAGCSAPPSCDASCAKADLRPWTPSTCDPGHVTTRGPALSLAGPFGSLQPPEASARSLAEFLGTTLGPAQNATPPEGAFTRQAWRLGASGLLVYETSRWGLSVEAQLDKVWPSLNETEARDGLDRLAHLLALPAGSYSIEAHAEDADEVSRDGVQPTDVLSARLMGPRETSQTLGYPPARVAGVEAGGGTHPSTTVHIEPPFVVVARPLISADNATRIADAFAQCRVGNLTAPPSRFDLSDAQTRLGMGFDGLQYQRQYYRVGDCPSIGLVDVDAVTGAVISRDFSCGGNFPIA